MAGEFWAMLFETEIGPPQNVRLSEWLGVSALVRGVIASVRSTLAEFEPCASMACITRNHYARY